ncbi:PAS domain-containing protein [Streptomyces sp. NPDC059991]|uniref:hybrid sensor histidine kinase/response regulator n=1 Tax=Streptomyces sp. NPDC059991 TaxID=3347028 RepID=UPI0036AF7502
MSSRPSRGAARLAAILDALPDGLVLVNCNGTVVNANTIALEMFESPGTGLVGRGVLDLLPTFDSKLIPGSMRRPDTEDELGRTKPTRMVARRTDGSEFPVEVTSANLEDGRDAYASPSTSYGVGGAHYSGDELLMIVVRDLSGTVDTEAELARSQRQTEMILRAAAEGVVGTDTEGRVVLVNPAAAQILGYRASDLGGQELHPLVLHSRADGEPFPYEESPLADTLKSGRKHRVRGQMLWAKSGAGVPVDLTTAPVRDGDLLVGAVMTFTDRRPYEDQAKKHAEVLERETTRYDALSARHQQLLSVLGGSLRGPLDELRRELSTLAADDAGQLWPEANQVLHHLAAGYARMTTLVDNVLAFQRLDSGTEELKKAKVLVGTVVAAGVEGAVELIGPGRAQFAVHAPPIEAEIDPARLSTALAHLVADVAGVDATGNAPVAAGGYMDSTVVVAAAVRGEVVRIEVRGPYAGGDPVHEPIVQGIVRAHGGVLQTVEVPGMSGSAYVLEVPLGEGAGSVPEPAAAEIAVVPAQQPAGSGRRRARRASTDAFLESPVEEETSPTGRRRARAQDGPPADPSAASPAALERIPAQQAAEGEGGGAGSGGSSAASSGTGRGVPGAGPSGGPGPGGVPGLPGGSSSGTPAGSPGGHPFGPGGPSGGTPNGPAAGMPGPEGSTGGAHPYAPDNGPAGPNGGPGEGTSGGPGAGPSGDTGGSSGTGRRRGRPSPAEEGTAPAMPSEGSVVTAAESARRPGAGRPAALSETVPPQGMAADPAAPSGRRARRALPASSGDARAADAPTADAEPGGRRARRALAAAPEAEEGAVRTAFALPPADADRPARPGGFPAAGPASGPADAERPPATGPGRPLGLPGAAPGQGTGIPVDPNRPGVPDPHQPLPAPSAPAHRPLANGPGQSGGPTAAPAPAHRPLANGPAQTSQTGQPLPATGRGRHDAVRNEAADEHTPPQPHPVEQPAAWAMGGAVPANGPETAGGPGAVPQPARQPLPAEAAPAPDDASQGRSISVRTLGQGVAFTQQTGGSSGSGRRRKLGTPSEGERPAGTAEAERPGPSPTSLLSPPSEGQGRAYAIGAPDKGAEGPEPLDGPGGAVEVANRPHPQPVDDELPPEPLDNPRRLLVWPAPDVSTSQALSDRGYRPVVVHSREEVDAQIAAFPAALFVDPLTGPITRTALQSLRQAAVAAEVPVLVTAGLGQATREAAYGADPAVLLKALAPRDSEQHPPRVLLIEEHEEIALALTATLERRGMQVARAATDTEAVTLAGQMRPNLVVMDLMQVRRRRAGIVDWLRANGQLNRTPLVVYTSAGLNQPDLPKLSAGETVLFLAERSTSTEVQGRIVDLLAKIGTN